jgi:hypothetical protein
MHAAEVSTGLKVPHGDPCATPLAQQAVATCRYPPATRVIATCALSYLLLKYLNKTLATYV